VGSWEGGVKSCADIKAADSDDDDEGVDVVDTAAASAADSDRDDDDNDDDDAGVAQNFEFVVNNMSGGDGDDACMLELAETIDGVSNDDDLIVFNGILDEEEVFTED